MSKYIFITISLFVSLQICSAQHFDPIYNIQEGEYRTWRDSGYYFMPELTDWRINNIFSNSSKTGLAVSFTSSDEGGLMYTGKAILIINNDDLPAGINFSRRDTGSSLMMIPQDLLLCPSGEQEMNMGQDDPYFPLYLSGSIDQYNNTLIDSPVPITIQLNSMRVN